MGKKIIYWVISAMIMFSQIAWAATEQPEVTAKSAVVMEAATGKILYEKNAYEQRYPASTTKIATLITALEYGNMNDNIITSGRAANTDGSSLYLNDGEQMKLQDMLYGVMLVSGNDATVAIAEHISGSVEEFAKLMTKKAHDIGAVHTQFVNSSGLPDPNHYTTAYDLALISDYGYHNDLFRQIVSTKNKYIKAISPAKDHDIYNENRMLWLYEGANGVKTGYTDAAGRCLVSGANRNGIQLIVVVLDSERMWDDSIALLDYGFGQILPQTIAAKDDIMKTIRVQNGFRDSIRLVASESMVVPSFKEDKLDYTTVIDVPNSIQAPISEGQKIGTMKAVYNNKVIATIDLVAKDGVERRSFFGSVLESVWSFLTFFIHNFA